METFKPPSALNLTGNLRENWRRWIQQFELFLTASGKVKKTEKVQCAILLHLIGDEALEIYNTFTFVVYWGSPKKVPSIEIRPFVVNLHSYTFGNFFG